MISGRNKLVQSNVHFAVGRKDIGQSAVNVNIDAVHFADRQNHTGTLRHRIGVTRLQNLADIEFAVVFDLNPGFFFYIDNDTALAGLGASATTSGAGAGSALGSTVPGKDSLVTTTCGVVVAGSASAVVSITAIGSAEESAPSDTSAGLE